MNVIRKGTNPVQVPFRLRTSEPALAAWANQVATAIQQLRDRVPQALGRKGGGGGASGGCTPWKPRFSTSGETHYVRFDLGLLDQMAATNWDAEQAIDAGATKWPTLLVSASEGGISSFSISLEDTTPTTTETQENTPPGSFKIVLGVIHELQAEMAVCENLEAVAVELMRISKATPAAGEEPFTRVWKWAVYQQASGIYPYVT
jgi:hypothetical protein